MNGGIAAIHEKGIVFELGDVMKVKNGVVMDESSNALK